MHCACVLIIARLLSVHVFTIVVSCIVFHCFVGQTNPLGGTGGLLTSRSSRVGATSEREREKEAEKQITHMGRREPPQHVEWQAWQGGSLTLVDSHIYCHWSPIVNRFSSVVIILSTLAPLLGDHKPHTTGTHVRNYFDTDASHLDHAKGRLIPMRGCDPYINDAVGLQYRPADK